jgi:NMD protein affecting ribosome stability and mRNA decay
MLAKKIDEEYKLEVKESYSLIPLKLYIFLYLLRLKNLYKDLIEYILQCRHKTISLFFRLPVL